MLSLYLRLSIDKKFSKAVSIPSILVRKNDPTDKHFNKIMEYFGQDKVATAEDLEAVKGEAEDEKTEN